MIELYTPIEFTSLIQPIKLPNDCGEDLLSTKVTTMVRGDSGTSPVFALKPMNLTITQNEFCSLANSDSIVCADSSISYGVFGTWKYIAIAIHLFEMHFLY